jgi:prophage regulatory protein
MQLLRIRDVMKITGLSRMTIYRMEGKGEFPPRRRLGQNSVAWLEDDIANWATQRPVVSRALIVSARTPGLTSTSRVSPASRPDSPRNGTQPGECRR